MTDRIQAIQSMLAKSPRDVFLHYSLGMEHSSAGQFEQAVVAFRRCIEIDEAYLPAYVEAGKNLRSAGRIDEARQAFSAGLDLAERQGERHVADFIRQQLQDLIAR